METENGRAVERLDSGLESYGSHRHNAKETSKYTWISS